MRICFITVTLLLLLFNLLQVIKCSAEDQLITNLLKNYNKRARPYPNGSSEPVEISMEMGLNAIVDLDAKERKFVIQAYVLFTWKDPRLSWNVSDYQEIKKVVLHPSDMWVPDTTGLHNTQFNFFDDSRIFAISHANGDIKWGPDGIIHSMCGIDIKYFPFDDQVCTLEFGSWAYEGKEVNITLSTNEINIGESLEHVEWKIVKALASRHETHLPCCSNINPHISFTFHLRRKPLYFIVNIIVPSVMLSVLTLMVFLLPPESGEKISLGVTILVTYALFTLIVSENVPRSSDAVPVIVLYLVFCMGCSTLGIILSVLVLHLYHKNGDDPPPNWLHKLSNCLSVLSRCRKVKSLHCNRTTSLSRYPTNQRESDTIGREAQSKKIGKTCSVLNQTDERWENAKEWKSIAMILDKFFFLLFGTLVLVILCAILLIVPLMKPEIDIKTFHGT